MMAPALAAGPASGPNVTVQPPPPHGLGSMAQTTDSLAPSPLLGEGGGEGAERLRPNSPDGGLPALELGLELGLMAIGLVSHPTGGKR